MIPGESESPLKKRALKSRGDWIRTSDRSAPSREEVGVYASLSVPRVPIVHGRGSSGRIGRSSRYQVGTTKPVFATPAIKRQVFASFCLQIASDKVERRVELSATVSEAVADAFENAKALQAEGSSVVVRDIAGARFVSRYDARIVERARCSR